MSENLLKGDWAKLPLSDIAQLAPIQPLAWSLAKEHGIGVWVKREDLLHPELGGNKFYKLYFHLQAMRASGCSQLLTFGGPYSNHICAVAAAGEALGFSTIGVIRGEQAKELSPTLVRAKAQGMLLHFISREAYRNKNSQDLREQLNTQFGDFYTVPEGGGDHLGAKGCQLWGEASLDLAAKSFTHAFVACGTGATLAGLLAASYNHIPSLHGIMALKGSKEGLLEFKANVLTLAKGLISKNKDISSVAAGLHLETNYHCGGYAKFPLALQQFADAFEQDTQTPVDRVYTAKLFWGIADMIKTGNIAPGSEILVFHTGGLQAAR